MGELMPTTNEDRREVAARVRDMVKGCKWYDYDLFFAFLMDALLMDTRASVGEILWRVADLIEPEERTCHSVKVWFKCSECMKEYDEWDEHGLHHHDGYPLSYCPNCGAKVVSE